MNETDSRSASLWFPTVYGNPKLENPKIRADSKRFRRSCRHEIWGRAPSFALMFRYSNRKHRLSAKGRAIRTCHGVSTRSTCAEQLRMYRSWLEWGCCFHMLAALRIGPRSHPVEMECSVFLAEAGFQDVRFGQLSAAGDDARDRDEPKRYFPNQTSTRHHSPRICWQRNVHRNH